MKNHIELLDGCVIGSLAGMTYATRGEVAGTILLVVAAGLWLFTYTFDREGLIS